MDGRAGRVPCEGLEVREQGVQRNEEEGVVFA